MRAMILVVAAAALSACNGDPASGNAAESERNVTSEVAVTNDTTAIDAATGEAADMAADVDFMPDLDNQTDGNGAASSTTDRPASNGSAESPDTADTDTP